MRKRSVIRVFGEETTIFVGKQRESRFVFDWWCHFSIKEQETCDKMVKWGLGTVDQAFGTTKKKVDLED